ncbi:F-box protein [Forsythia ovata]|uniref:F-box protein n=1 Tax=Forsythia ovata TaxID=205694 RepID=A0ABD1PXA2_9LAMI
MSIESYSNFQVLPEGFIADALSLTSPKDACRLSSVTSTFRSAAEYDTVWERFLPPDYRDIISRSIDGADLFLAKFRTKKELYLHLCDNPILIDGGTKSFSLEKGTGNKCFMLPARDLLNGWGVTPKYWQWISLPESRFPEAAELHHAQCWSDIGCKINTSMLSSGTKYAAYLVFTSRPRIYGFQNYPLDIEALVGISGQEVEKRIVCLNQEGEQRHRNQFVPFIHGLACGYTEYPKCRDDGWMAVELGEFLVKGKQDCDMEMYLREVWRNGNWKNGLTIQGCFKSFTRWMEKTEVLGACGIGDRVEVGRRRRKSLGLMVS